jgi:hypothetical protein
MDEVEAILFEMGKPEWKTRERQTAECPSLMQRRKAVSSLPMK